MTGAGSSQRLLRSARLSNSGQFRRVFEHPIRATDRAFTVLARRNQYRHARLGLAISRKCASRAVARNRIKRLVRESFRAAQSEMPPVDLVIMCRAAVNDMSNTEIRAALDTHWRRLTIRCKEA